MTQSRASQISLDDILLIITAFAVAPGVRFYVVGVIAQVSIMSIADSG